MSKGLVNEARVDGLEIPRSPTTWTTPRPSSRRQAVMLPDGPGPSWMPLARAPLTLPVVSCRCEWRLSGTRAIYPSPRSTVRLRWLTAWSRPMKWAPRSSFRSPRRMSSACDYWVRQRKPNLPANSMPLRAVRRRGAKRRDGVPCQSPAVRCKTRCMIHGGTAGSGAPCGERNGQYRHGLFTCEAIEERRAAWTVIEAAKTIEGEIHRGRNNIPAP
jgi:hypothetical protein